MTNEEAILYMVLYRAKLLDSVSDLDKDIEAYDKAISALTARSNMNDNIKNLIEDYQRNIELLEEDRKTDGMTISNAYRVAKIGVYGKVIADLEAVLEGSEE